VFFFAVGTALLSCAISTSVCFKNLISLSGSLSHAGTWLVVSSRGPTVISHLA
jgi:hypothetical protein